MFLDIVNDKCPITFVKTKIALESLKPGETLILHLSGGEALENIPASLKELGYSIIDKKKN